MKPNETPGTATPPAPGPHAPAHVFLCPSCECALDADLPDAESASQATPIERFTCPSGCGVFEHDTMTRRLRLVENTAPPTRR